MSSECQLQVKTVVPPASALVRALTSCPHGSTSENATRVTTGPEHPGGQRHGHTATEDIKTQHPPWHWQVLCKV